MAVTSRQQTVLIPVQRDALPLAPLLPIQRDRRSVSPVPVRRLTKLVVAFGVSFFLWLFVIAGVAALTHAL
jgi:hypothetical protein